MDADGITRRFVRNGDSGALGVQMIFARSRCPHLQANRRAAWTIIVGSQCLVHLQESKAAAMIIA
jgi:hypothetical protein